jgi:hypothetical protein
VLKVLDERERLVEPMKQLAPLLIVGRASESNGVVLKAIPLDQQEEHIRSLDAPRQCQRLEAGDSADDRFRLGKRRAELIAHPSSNWQQCMLNDHPTTLDADWRRPSLASVADRRVQLHLAANVEEVVLRLMQRMYRNPPQRPFARLRVVVDHCAIPVVVG